MTEIKRGEATITLGDELALGSLCRLYRCTYKSPKPADGGVHGDTWYDKIMSDDNIDGVELAAVLKVDETGLNADLLENEAQVLRFLFPPTARDEKFYRYLPRLLDSFVYDSRTANLFVYLEGYVSVADILKAYPAGVDYRDFAWMFKRLLVGIGYAHTKHVVHGGIVPSHIMVHPEAHGAKILDWTCSEIDPKRSVRAYEGAWRDFYAPEVFAKRFPVPATDIFMAGKCAVALLGGNVKTGEMPDRVPEEIRTLITRCLAEKPSSRPQDAWDLHEEFDKILLEKVGKPKYRPFPMPGVT